MQIRGFKLLVIGPKVVLEPPTTGLSTYEFENLI